MISNKFNLNKSFQAYKICQIKYTAKRPRDSSLDVSLATEILNEKPLKIKKC